MSLRFVRRDLKEAAPTLDGQLVTALMRNITAMTAHFVDAAAFTKLVRISISYIHISYINEYLNLKRGVDFKSEAWNEF